MRNSWTVVIVALLLATSSVELGRGQQSPLLFWTQTSQADFESGFLVNLDTSSSPGDVRLAEFSEFVIGSPALNRTQNSGTELFTLILDEPGFASDRAGFITSFEIWTENLGGTVQVRVFRDNGTHFLPIADGPSFIVDETPFRKGIRIQAGINDLLAATISGAELDFEPSNNSSRIFSGSVTAPSRKLDWTQFNRTWSLSAQIGVQGLLVSSPKDTKGPSTWGSISWTSSPEGTSARIIFNTRTSPDGEAWTEWSPDYESSGQSIISPANRFIQYKATFLSGSRNDIPTLYDVTLSFLTEATPNPSALFLWSDKTKARLGGSVRVSGKIMPAQVESIVLTSMRPDGNTENLTLISGTDGLVSQVLELTAEGTWIVVLSFAGSRTLTPATSNPLVIQVEGGAEVELDVILTSASLVVSFLALTFATRVVLKSRGKSVTDTAGSIH